MDEVYKLLLEVLGIIFISAPFPILLIATEPAPSIISMWILLIIGIMLYCLGRGRQTEKSKRRATK